MTAMQAAADALLAAAQMPGGFVVDFAGSTWRVRSPYSREVCGHGATLVDAALAYVASRAFDEAWRDALAKEHADLAKREPSGVTLLSTVGDK